MSQRGRRVRNVVLAVALAPLVWALALATPYFARAMFSHNLVEVVPQRLYRSAEMPRDDLAETIQAHGIKSVIDLRLGEDRPDASGRTEEEVARAHGAQYRKVSMTSSRASQRERLLRLIDAFDELPPPVLVHCTSGSERSGVASALWLLEKEQRSPEEACDQLALRYGFNQVERDLRTFLQGEPTLDRVVTEYARARASGAAGSFREWARDARMLDEPLP